MFLATTLVVGALSTGPFPEFPSAINPFGVEGAKPSESVLAAGQPGGLACVIVTLLSLIVRFYFSRRIVAGNHKGDIRLLSKPGDTRFQFRLPM
jgi:hypothetical protein